MIQSQRELLSNFIMVAWVEYKIDIRRGTKKQRRRKNAKEHKQIQKREGEER